MYPTTEIAKLAIQDRQRDAADSRLARLAQRLADCCRPATLRMRIAAAIRAAGDVCCPPLEEQTARALRAISNG